MPLSDPTMSESLKEDTNSGKMRSTVPAGEKGGVQSSYGQILRSSALIGGSAALNVVVGVLRTKAMAVLLGPAGYGLMSTFTTIADLGRSTAQMGINGSGVRQIAESVSTGDRTRVAKTVIVLRRVGVALAALGAVLLIALSDVVSQFTFGDSAHAPAIAILSLAVAFRLLSDSQGAMLQGMRRIGDMAKGSIAGAVLGSAASVAIVYWLREDGVAVALVMAAGLSLAVNWWYTRRVELPPVDLSREELRAEAFDLLKLGAAFMTSGIMMMGAAYLVRIIILRNEGLEAAGLYQAAWAVGGMYVGLILQAMGSDFYPRLVGAVGNNAESARLVNEQSEVSILLAAPGIIATLVVAPTVLSLLYSAAFEPAVDALRWVCVGVALRVVSWPMGFIVVAKNSRVAFISTELAWAAFNVGATWFAVQRWGFAGAGIAFFASYMFHVVMIRIVVGRMTGFTWSPRYLKLMLAFVGLTAVVHIAFLTQSKMVSNTIGALAFLTATGLSLHGLCTLVPPEQMPRRLRPLASLAQRIFAGRAV